MFGQAVELFPGGPGGGGQAGYLGVLYSLSTSSVSLLMGHDAALDMDDFTTHRASRYCTSFHSFQQTMRHLNYCKFLYYHCSTRLGPMQRLT